MPVGMPGSAAALGVTCLRACQATPGPAKAQLGSGDCDAPFGYCRASLLRGVYCECIVLHACPTLALQVLGGGCSSAAPARAAHLGQHLGGRAQAAWVGAQHGADGRAVAAKHAAPGAGH
jgi:hypothetical protein